MTDRKQRDMTKTRADKEKAAKVGATILRIREARGMSREAVGAAYYGSGYDAIRKIEDGISGAEGFVKLAKLAEILRSSPNELLDWQDQDAILGVMEGIALACGLPPEQASPLAELVLEVLNSPDIRNTGIPLRDIARTVGSFEARKFLRK